MVVIQHDGSTDGTCEILTNGIGTTSGALNLRSGGTTYTFPSSGNETFAVPALSSSTAIVWETKQIAEISKSSSQSISSGQDIVWSTFAFNVSDFALASGNVGINTVVNRHFEITVQLGIVSMSSDMAFRCVNGSGSNISSSFKFNRVSSGVSEPTTNSFTFLHSTYGGVNFQVRVRCISGSGLIIPDGTRVIIKAL